MQAVFAPVFCLLLPLHEAPSSRPGKLSNHAENFYHSKIILSLIMLSAFVFFIGKQLWKTPPS